MLKRHNHLSQRRTIAFLIIRDEKEVHVEEDNEEEIESDHQEFDEEKENEEDYFVELMMISSRLGEFRNYSFKPLELFFFFILDLQNIDAKFIIFMHVLCFECYHVNYYFFFIF